MGHAMREFPRNSNELQGTFCSGIYWTRAVDGCTAHGAAAGGNGLASFVERVEFQMDKKILDEQAELLMTTNYVYAERATYRKDRLADYPDQRADPRMHRSLCQAHPDDLHQGR